MISIGALCLAAGVGDGGGSGGAAEGSMSTVSKGGGGDGEGEEERDYIAGLSDASSAAYDGGTATAVEEEGLELHLCLGGAAADRRPRILTAEDISARAKSPNSSSSSVSSSSPASPYAAAAVAGGRTTRRAAGDHSYPPSGQVVVGWPPIGSYRINSLANQSKGTNLASNVASSLKKNNFNSNDAYRRKSVTTKDQGKKTGSLFIKVNMDGELIGRKVDLSAHESYASLALALEDMFLKPSVALATSIHGTKSPRILGGSSEYTLTYEDKDGDWMLVGDVPWRMFLGTVKRLRIMRTSDASGFGPRH